jgi:7-alpha-hydroxysteroid dehydrogenase
MKLQSKIALIAGGGQGIGEGISLCLAEEGADVAIADINAEHAEKVTQKAEAMGRRALAIPADLTDDREAQKSVQKTVEFFGRIDILINNVGGVSGETLMQVGENRNALGDEDQREFMFFNSNVWDRYYKLNLKTHVILSQAVTPYFIKQRSGKIINISSVSGRLPEPGHMPYGSMKAAFRQPGR